MYRKGNSADWTQVISLWGKVFGDSPDVVERCITNFIGKENIYVAQQDDIIVSILFAVPCWIGDRKGRYLFALATNPDFRGSGSMTALMEYAEQQEKNKGAEFACLIPATDELYAYYDKRGYSETIYLRAVTRPIRKNILAQAEIDTVSASRLELLRKQYMKFPYIAFSDESYREIIADVYAAGAETAETTGAYAVYYYNKDTLLVAELGARSDQEASELLEAIAQRTGIFTVEITLAEESKLFEAEGMQQKVGMLKPLASSLPQQPYYLRFALDEIWKP